MILGKNLILAIGNTPLAASKSCRVSKSKSFIEVASPTSSAWESFIPSKKGWSMNADCLIGTMEAYKTLDAAWKNDTALTIRFYDTEYNENETGTAYIENLELTASNGSLATMSVSLKGSGELSEYIPTNVTLNTIDDTQDFSYLYRASTGDFVTDTHDQPYTKLATMTLSERSFLLLDPSWGYIIWSQNDHLVGAFEHEASIDREDYDGFASDITRQYFDAGTYYLILTTDSNSVYNPTIKKLS